MGQKGSSSEPRSSPGAGAEDAQQAHSSSFRDLDRYMGKCWLLSANANSFSPSRWFPLCERTTDAVPAACRERSCFSLAPARPMPAKERKRNSNLLALPVLVLPPGLTLTLYTKVTAATFRPQQLRGKHSVLVGGVPVDMARVNAHGAGGTEALPAVAAYVCVVVVWRADVEMTPAQYATAPYTRHRVKSPATTPAERQAYGEGCITGVRYGALMVASTASPNAASSIVDALKRAGGALADAELRAVEDDDCSGDAGDANAMLEVTLDVLDMNGGRGKPRTVQDCVRWAAELYNAPQQWSPLSLFLQRYEAIGQCLLTV